MVHEMIAYGGAWCESWGGCEIEGVDLFFYTALIYVN